MMSNASLLTTAGGPATLAEATAVQNGNFGCYYPAILYHVDQIVAPALTLPTIGVMPDWGDNASTVMQTLWGPPQILWWTGGGQGLPPQVWNNQYHSDYMGGATLDRIAARTVETYFIAKQMLSWFNQLDKTQPSNTTRYWTWGGRTDRKAPYGSLGAGLTEAPRGALGHWIRIGVPRTAPPNVYRFYRGRVSNYQIITPTAWNISPKDHNDKMGPIERCIWGTPVVAGSEPLEIIRVTHSFDICAACTVHVMNPKKEKVFEAKLEPSP
jgi:hypothetical protein